LHQASVTQGGRDGCRGCLGARRTCYYIYRCRQKNPWTTYNVLVISSSKTFIFSKNVKGRHESAEKMGKLVSLSQLYIHIYVYIYIYSPFLRLKMHNLCSRPPTFSRRDIFRDCKLISAANWSDFITYETGTLGISGTWLNDLVWFSNPTRRTLDENRIIQGLTFIEVAIWRDSMN
jgi:hypothetical protein